MDWKSASEFRDVTIRVSAGELELGIIGKKEAQIKVTE